MSVRSNTTLWRGIQLPPWDAEQLFELFVRHNSGDALGEVDLDTYTRLLMHAVGIRFSAGKWHSGLPKLGLDPSDVAQEVVNHLLRKTARMRLRHPCYKVLLSIIYRECHFAVMTRIDASRTKSALVLASAVSTSNSPKGSGPMYSTAPAESPDVDKWSIARFLRSAESLAIDDIKGDAYCIQAAYRFQCRRAWGHGSLATWDELPKRLRRGLCSIQHALIVLRVVRLVERFIEIKVYREEL